MTPGDLIKEIIYRSDLNQSKIAELIGVRQASISRIRHGVNGMSVKTARSLIQLAAEYKITATLEDLLPMD